MKVITADYPIRAPFCAEPDWSRSGRGSHLSLVEIPLSAAA
jgi:hypothetical protein